MAIPPFYLLRHGETEWNREDRRQGRLGSPLTEKGVRQAEAMGRAVARDLMPGAAWTLVSSPQQRALQTAEIVGRHCNLPVKADDRLMEISMGSWEGLTWPEIEARWPGMAGDHNTAHFRIPDGEPYEAVAERARSWLNSLTQPVIAVSHGIFGRVLRVIYLGLDRNAYAGMKQSGQDEYFLLANGRIETRRCDGNLSS